MTAQFSFGLPVLNSIDVRRATCGVVHRTAACMFAAALGAFVVYAIPANAQQKVLTVGAATFPSSLMTGVSSFTSESLILQTYDPLVMRDNAGNFLPALAEKWEPQSDIVWRFHLRKDVKWQDGKEFTAEDVKFTLDRVIDPQTAYGYLGRIGQVSGAMVVDKYTVDITTKTTFPTLPKGLSDIVMEAKHYYDEVGSEIPKRKPMGTGPFIATSWVPGDHYELVANKNYWGGAPKVDKLVIRQIPEASTRVAALISGEVQIIEEVPVDVISEIEASKRATIVSIPTSAGLVLTYDSRRPPFDNAKVREAFDFAVDKNLLIKELLKGKGEELQGQLLTAATFGHNPDIKARPFDPAKAKQLLKEANFDFSKPVAIMTQSGKYLSDVDISNAVAGMLRNVGVEANVNVVESAVYLKQWSALEMGPMYMVGWYSLNDADFATIWYTEGSRRSVWNNAEYEKLFIEARSTNDQGKREKAYHRMMEIMHAENPSMFLFGIHSIYAASDKVHGFGAAADKILRLKSVSID
jgi:peptide/nickel transport system substrate-binding protein